MTAKAIDQYGKVAVLMGGISGERSISLKSGAAVINALQANHVDAHAIDVGTDVIKQLIAGDFTRAFIILHGCGGEDGTMQGALQTINMPYTGSGVMASSICMNKIITKQLWAAADIPTPSFMVLDASINYQQVARQLGDVFIVKPSREGSSLGIHCVHNEEEFIFAIEEAQKHQGQLMAEQWIVGKEYTVAVVNDQPLPVIRLKTNNEFYDYEAKYQSNDTQYLLPCGLDGESEASLKTQAQRAFAATGAQGWGRVDVMIDEQGQPWFLEVNTVPGMTDHSLVPMAAAHAGIDFNALVLQILETSFLERY